MVACNYNGARDRKPLVPTVRDVAPVENEKELKNLSPDQIDFATIKKNILEPHCISCHSETKSKGDVKLENYADVLKHLKMFEKDIVDNSMPPKPKPLLPQTLKDLVLNWIKNGARETKDSKPSPITDPTSHLNVSEKEIYSRGQYLFNLSSCDSCHTVDGMKPLAGGLAMTTKFGTFYTTNISKDPKTGIGAWSPQDFLRAMRKGKSPSGKLYYPVFPYTNYSKMSDSDLMAIRFYILNLPGTEQENTPHDLKLMYSLRFTLEAWRLMFFPFWQTDRNYLISQGPFKSVKDKDAQWNRGAYLVEGPLHCTVCHTPRIPVIGGVRRSVWMSGSTDSGESFPAPNITPDFETGLGRWSSTDWMNFLNQGTTPSGDAVVGKMRKIVRYGTAQMTEEDKKAVVKYLMSLKPIKNQKLFDFIKSHPKPKDLDETEMNSNK